jgi:hypothetical protein
MVTTGVIKMTEKFENPEVEKVDDETVSNPSTQKKIDLVADKAAEKPAKAEQQFDKDNSNLFSR